MTKAATRGPLPFDSEAAAKETERREALATNSPYLRGVAQAQAQELSNARGALDQWLRDLARVSLKRDTTQPARDAYDRCWKRGTPIAQRVTAITGEQISIPAWLPPPAQADVPTITVGPPAHDTGTYRETKGMGKSGKGGPAPGFPGTDADQAWLNVQGGTK